MAPRLAGKVAFISGIARGQGRSHACRLAQEGADIIGLDICGPVGSTAKFYPPATEADLKETIAAVEQLDRRIIARQADVRDFAALQRVVDEGVAEFGRLDIVLGNAGIFQFGEAAQEITEADWRDVVDVDLTGVWHTCKATIPHLRAGKRGGSIILTASGAGIKGFANFAHYVAAKHGVLGLMKTLALELAPESIRVNVVAPANCDTDMIQNEASYRLFQPGLENPGRREFAEASTGMFALPVPWVEAIDVSNAIVFLASDEARYITGVTLPIDAGMTIK